MRSIKFILTGTLVVILGVGTFAQESSAPDPRVQWLNQHAIRVRSVEPTDEDFSDLDPLKKVLRGVRLVLLGEESHGDGTTFLAKSRLIKFLHQEMAFDILVFESGFYDCWNAWESFKTGEEIHIAFRQCVWPLWAERQQVQSLIEYVGEAYESGYPLVLAGLDPGFALSPSRDSLAPQLRSAIEACNLPGLEDERITNLLYLAEHLHDYRSRTLERPGAEKLETFVSTARDLARTLETSGGLSDRERAFWARILENLASDVPFTLAPASPPALELVEHRDRQMAQNLIWLMRSRYPGRKYVVWAATLHISRNLHQLDVEENTETPWGISLQELYRHKKVMGDYLREELGDTMYALGFTAFEGEYSVGAPDPRKIKEPSSGSLEDLLVKAGLDNAIVDFRRPATEAEWLHERLKSRPFGYSEMTGKWTEVLDGMMFTRVMTASTRVDNKEPK
jgi:erythromycin esterase